MQNLQTSQGYIFRILQDFATKLCHFSNFKVLFLAVAKDFVLPACLVRALVFYANCPFLTLGFLKVLKRILSSMVPVRRRNYLATQIRSNPDLYGKVWMGNRELKQILKLCRTFRNAMSHFIDDFLSERSVLDLCNSCGYHSHIRKSCELFGSCWRTQLDIRFSQKWVCMQEILLPLKIRELSLIE